MTALLFSTKTEAFRAPNERLASLLVSEYIAPFRRSNLRATKPESRVQYAQVERRSFISYLHREHVG